MTGESVDTAQALWTFKDIIFGLFTSTVAGIAAYLGAYLKKDAEITALSNNIAELKNQQVILTGATEQVKQDIEHQIWREKELLQVQRVKLEEASWLLINYPYNLEKEIKSNFTGIRELEFEQGTFEKIRVLIRLYFPQVEEDSVHFFQLAIEFSNWMEKKKTACKKAQTYGTSLALDKADEEFIHNRLYKISVESGKVTKALVSKSEWLITHK